MDIAKVKAALAPDHHSKAAYTGRVSQIETVTVFTEDGTPVQKEILVYISWDSIAEILTLIRQRSGIQS